MKILTSLVLCAASLSAFSQQYSEVFISSKDLSSRLKDPRTIVIHVDGPEGYTEGHIPGAMVMSSADFTTRNDNIVFEIPEPETFARNLAALGIDENSFIVISTGWDSFEHAFRLYYTLDYFGLGNQTRMLDGGLRGWFSEGHEISKEPAVPQASEPMTLIPQPDKLATRDWIVSNLENSDVKVLDARIDAFYSGKSGSFRRGGHIPNSGRVTWLDLVDDNFYLVPEKDLKKLFKDAGADEASTVATYCHIGLRASVLYTVAKSLGYDVKLYDGSMNEWETLGDEYPVSKGGQ
jgi:thiosulfate/3-mercaptopyruvate sulfurtransferase